MNNFSIQKIVEEVIKQLQEDSTVVSKPSILVIHPDTESSIEQVKQLDKYHEIIEVSLPAENKVDLPPYVKKAVFLEASQTLLVKGALGMSDTFESEWLSSLMHHGIETCIVPNHQLSSLLQDTIDPKTRNPAYQEMFCNYRKTLTSFGVDFRSFRELIHYEGRDKNIRSEDNFFREKLVTQKVLESWPGREIRVSLGTIVTPLAKDKAKQRGIKISVLEEW